MIIIDLNDIDLNDYNLNDYNLIMNLFSTKKSKPSILKLENIIYVNNKKKKMFKWSNKNEKKSIRKENSSTQTNEVTEPTEIRIFSELYELTNIA